MYLILRRMRKWILDMQKMTSGYRARRASPGLQRVRCNPPASLTIRTNGTSKLVEGSSSASPNESDLTPGRVKHITHQPCDISSF